VRQARRGRQAGCPGHSDAMGEPRRGSGVGWTTWRMAAIRAVVEGVSGKGPMQARRDAAPPSSAESHAAELEPERDAGRVPDEMRGVGV
jgi:hypothetical protein